MNNFWSLVSFEYKKIFTKKINIAVLILSFIIIVGSCFAMVIGNSQSNYSTEDMSNYEAMKQDKEFEKNFEGRPLDATLILEASVAYQKIDKNVTRYTQSEGYQKYARPYSSVYTLIDAAYVKAGAAFNIDDFQNISKEDAENYYVFRENQYRDNLTNNPFWSDKDVEKVMELDKQVQKPFIMMYKDGYQRFFALSVSTMMIILFAISFCISPIFSDEYAKKTDSLILTSKNGKRVFIYAKIFTSTSLSFIFTLLFSLATYFCCMAIYGFDGTNAQIQLLLPAITYNFTMLDATILVIICSILGAFFHTGICIAISSVSNNSLIPMAISFVLMCVGMFNGLKNEFFYQMRFFLPTAMGNFYDISTQLVFNVFGVEVMLYQMVCIVAFILGLMLITVSYRNFKNHQVA